MKSIWFNYIMHSLMAIFCFVLAIISLIRKDFKSMASMLILGLCFVGFFVFICFVHQKIKQTALWNKYFREKNEEALKLIAQKWHKKRPLLMSKSELALTDSILYLSMDDTQKAEESLAIAVKNKVWVNKYPAIYYSMLVALDKGEEEKAKELGDSFLEETKSANASNYFADMRKSVMFLLGYSDYPIKSEFFPIVDRLVNKKLEKNSGTKEKDL